jgi:ABC-type oligopeptide transport system substrate-binding subunit
VAVRSAVPAFEYLYNTSSGHKAIAEYLQAAFKKYGITMNLSNEEWATFLTTRKKGEFSVARNGWLCDYNDPITLLDMWTSDFGQQRRAVRQRVRLFEALKGRMVPKGAVLFFFSKGALKWKRWKRPM